MTDLSLFSGAQATLLARCHGRSALDETTAALRKVLNDSVGLTAGPARMDDSDDTPCTAFAIVHNGLRYQVAIQPVIDPIRKPTIE